MVALNQITALIIKDLMQVVRNRKFMVITESQMMDDEMEVSDRIADIINSIEIDA